MSKPHDIDPLNQLISVLTWSRDRDYRGHSKHDALNSPFLHTLSFGSRFLRLLAIQALMRFPVNVRSLFGVPRLRNPKGIGLFAHAWFDLAERLKGGDREVAGWTHDACIEEGERLLSWLVHHVSPWTRVDAELLGKFSYEENDRDAEVIVDAEDALNGVGWGYHYPWQDVGFFQPRHFPNRVVSSWIGFAFIRAFEVTSEQRYLEVAREILVFHFENPKRLVDTENELCLSYVPLDDMAWAVMDVSALVASLCAQVGYHDQDETLLAEAKRLITFVVSKQTDYGAWFYTWPAKDSHIKHDNYHTGIILDTLADYMKYTGDHSLVKVYRRGLRYYGNHLFMRSGAPRWMNDKTYPHDIHGSAAGILAYRRAEKYFKLDAEESNLQEAERSAAIANRIASWTSNQLYDEQGFFYYQKTRFYKKKFCLMRWCNAWMCRALSAG